jgi:hypothetical protein
VDIDGEAWANPPSIGCDEYRVGAVSGPLTVVIESSYTNVVPGFVVDFRAQIEGRASASRWDFGDGTVVSNQPYTSHSWAAVGEYLVVLRAFNDSHPEGVTAMLIARVIEPPVLYVALNSATPVPPYVTWATAATNIQDAINAAAVPGSLVVVSNGVYETGGQVVNGATNRVAITKPLTVRSVNGPDVTVIKGYRMPGNFIPDSSVRCVFLTNGAVLTGFTLTNGRTAFGRGGGVWSESTSAVVSNCILAGNSAHAGGGAYSGTLNNCTLAGNSAFEQGGGAYRSTLNNSTLRANSSQRSGGGAESCTLNNCLLTANSASPGGGAAFCTLNNCTLTGNSAPGGVGGGASSSTLNNCTLTANSAFIGGGAAGGTLNNCTLTANSADPCLHLNAVGGYGGGAVEATLNNCTLVANSACSSGGGASQGTLNNCIAYYNTAASGVDLNYSGAVLNFSCTTPLPADGVGNITNAPLFVNQAGTNLRLQSISPCINAGRNADAPGGLDLDGRLRIVGGTVDIGAYEFQGLTTNLFVSWLRQYRLPTDISSDGADSDADSSTNWQEWRAGTDPTDAQSLLHLLRPEVSGADVVLRWESVPGRSYFVERSSNLASPAGFTPLARDIPGQSGTTTYTDTGALNAGPFFYRIGVYE